MDVIDRLSLTRAPTARRPLLGQTVLLVEDSRFASEAVRLMCLRSGARIRRADSLKTAQRHLAIYMPSVLIVDIGLPDGSGIDLIKAASDASARIDVILGTSGDAAMQKPVMDAGADDFIEKPVESLMQFQSRILAHIPPDRQPPSPRGMADEQVHPDLIAYQDDLACNGYELVSGAIRNHRPEVMFKAFEIAGYGEDEVRKRFGGMVNAFQYGAPPHGGCAAGIDRIVMLLANASNIREVIMFPMNQRAEDLMMDAPSEPMNEQLRELRLRVLPPES